MTHDCIMEEKITTAISGMENAIGEIRNTVKWALGIFAGFILFLVVGVTTFGGTSLTNKANITKIQGDYLPYFAFEYIVESNNKLMNRWSALESKDDARIQQSIVEWNKLQEEVIKQAGINKRSVKINK